LSTGSRAPGRTPRASVIIPAHNAAGTLCACLRAVKAQTLPPGTYEVLVVDDGSTDGTAERALAEGAQVLRQPHRGAAAARNLGARHARGGILCFTDADCQPAPDWLAELLLLFEDPRVVGARGVYRSRQSAPVARFVQLEYEDRYRRTREFPQIDFIDTYSAAYRTDLFLTKGGFDESFPGASVEDQEFSFRLAKHGYCLVFQPSAIVYHRHPTSWWAYARKKFRIGYWKVQVLRRHPARLARDTHTPAVVRLQVGLAGLTLLSLALAPFWSWGRWVAGGAVGAFAISAVPFSRFVWARDPALGPVLPLLLATRALALGFGLVCGVFGLAIRSVLQRLPPAPTKDGGAEEVPLPRSKGPGPT